MIKYKLYIRTALSGVVTKILPCKSKDDLYMYVGKLFLNSIEKIERVDFEVLSEGGET